MKFYALYETAPGTGTYRLGAVEIEAASTSDAVAAAAKSAPAGCRTGVWPYKSVAGLPDNLPPATGEAGQMYIVLAQPAGASGAFAPNGQVFGSFVSDAAGMTLSLERFFGYRLGLLPENAKPAPAAVPDTPAAPVASSGTVSSGVISSGGTSSGGASTISSGGSASLAG